MFASPSMFSSIVALSAVVIASSSQAAFLEIIDDGGSGPVQILSDISSNESQTTFSNGTTRFTALIAVNTLLTSIAVGTRSVALLEPSGRPDAPITDLITFTAEEPFSAPIIHIPFQKITVDFTPGRFGPLTAPPGAILIPETGQLQGLSDALSTSPFVFGVRSVGGSVVPEPSLVWLLAGGLLALCVYRLFSAIAVFGRSLRSTCSFFMRRSLSL